MSLDVLNLALVLAAALAGGWVANRFGYPAILGELAAGILLGPPLLGLLSADDALTVIGKLGVVLLMLYIGLHLDPRDIGGATKPGALAAVGGFVVPAALGFGLMMVVDGDVTASLFVAVAMGVTSLATKSRILVDLGILNTRIAHVLMAGALFSDVAALIIFAAILGVAATGAVAAGGIALTAFKAALFLGGAWLIGTRVFPVVGRMLTTRRSGEQAIFSATVLAGLAFAAAADAAGLHAILGAFLAGLFIKEGVLPHAGMAAVERRMRGLSVGFLAPVFFVIAGFNVSFSVFTEQPMLLVAVIVVATLGKLIGTALFYIPTGYGIREGLAVGAGMNGRGAVEIIVAEIALEAGLIDTTVFSILVFMAIFTTATVPILLTFAIRHLRHRGELVSDEREGVVILGANPTGLHLAKLLSGRDVTVIDSNVDHIRVAERLGIKAVKGDGLDETTLDEAGVRDAGIFVSTTPNGEINLLAAKVAAREFAVPRILVAMPMSATQAMHALLEDIDGGVLFGRPLDIAAWDSVLAAGTPEPLGVEMADTGLVDRSGTASTMGSSIEMPLPMLIRYQDRIEPYGSGAQWEPSAQVVSFASPETELRLRDDVTAT